MKKFSLFHLKNEMLGANFLANFVGVFFVNGLLLLAEGRPPEGIWTSATPYWIDALFTPFAFTFVAVLTVVYEKPIRRYLNFLFKGTAIPADLETEARRRLLNEPFVLIVLGFSMWLLAAVVYSLLHWIYGSGANMIQRSCFVSISTGLIVATIAFFLLEHISQKRLAPHFFPNGGLTRIPRTLRIKIRTRLAAFLFACNLIPLLSILQTLLRITGSGENPDQVVQQMRFAVWVNVFVFMAVGVILTILVSRNLAIPFREIIQTLNWVRKGRFDKKVQVTTNDEIGYTGDVINEMTEGLRERERLRQSLDLAMEVQQRLLPKVDPQVKGFDIAGASIYCEETGGDYYDYLENGDGGPGKISIVVGDVTDHGISSALLMTTVRAFLRQRASKAGDLQEIMTDVNKQLCRDVEDSGQFMTLFLCKLDNPQTNIRWVKAGHEPALLFDPASDSFTELGGNGLPLGVSPDTRYQESRKGLRRGQIILIGTDGIWESQNSQGSMFGKQRFKDLIRSSARRSAKDILQTVIASLEDFRKPLSSADDVTLVVVKVESSGNY